MQSELLTPGKGRTLASLLLLRWSRQQDPPSPAGLGSNQRGNSRT